MSTKGVVYTKSWAVNLILDAVGYTPSADIGRKVLLEPSCGCGAFLTIAVERLCAWIAATPEATWQDLSNCILAVDIDENAVEQAKAKVMHVLCQAGCPDDTARALTRKWFRIGDFLTLDIPIQVDFVVGNPPYVRATDISAAKRTQYSKLLECFTNGTDLFVGFFDRALGLLKSGGVLGYICADRWLQNKYGTLLRRKVNSQFNLEVLIRMHGVKAFDDDVDAYPAVTIIRNTARAPTFKFVNCDAAFSSSDVEQVKAFILGADTRATGSCFEAVQLEKPTGDKLYPLADAQTVQFVMDAMKKYTQLEQCGISIGIGIATGCDAVFVTDDETVAEKSRLLPLYHMRNKGKSPWFLVNPWEDNGALVDLASYPRLRSYFESHEEALKKRFVAKKNPSAWYRTIDKVHSALVGRPLILLPDLGIAPIPVISNKYPHHGCYWVRSDVWDLDVLAGLLMSTIVRRFIDAFAVKMRGGTLRFQAQYLRYLHLPAYESMTDEMKNGLKSAFLNQDKSKADHFARMVFGI